ncbi:MAG: metallophosphoesterase family protein [Candidatus Bathyarchaeia archaeon]
MVAKPRIGIFSDTHIGRCIPRAVGELRRTAYKHSFTQAINVFIDEGVDYVIHAGDLFEKRSMTPEDSVFVKEELQRLVDSIHDRYGKDVVVFAVRGNHDGTYEGNALDYIRHPLADYLRVLGDRLLQGLDEEYVHEGLLIAGVGYHPYISGRFQEIKPLIKKAFAHEGGLKIFIFHNFLEGYHPIPPGTPSHNLLTMRDLAGLGADIVVSGHYHGRLKPITRDGAMILTPGATEAVDLSDEGPFGVYILEDGEARFKLINPLHEIRNVKVSSKGALKPSKWFVDKALGEAKRYASSLEERGVNGILRLILTGLTDEDPYNIENMLASLLSERRAETPKLLYVDLVNRVEAVHQRVPLPAMGGGYEYASEILKPLGSKAEEALKIVEEVSLALDERASQRTGLLTGSDRSPFVEKWIRILEGKLLSSGAEQV